MNWENGMYICAGCHGEFDHSELEPVIGGIETDYCETNGEYFDVMTGERVEMTPEQFERSKRPYSILLCEDCRKERINETAAKLLAACMDREEM